MQVHFGTDSLAAEWPHSVVCIGTFDGVHLGHQEVIRRAAARGESRGVPSILVTFDRNPAAILAPERCKPSIASLQSNIAEFGQLGISLSLIVTFDKPFSETSAEAFFDGLILDKLRALEVVVGHDFTFGKGREGTAAWLQGRIETEIVPPVAVRGQRVSSSQIRNAVEAGDISLANELLGRPFEIPGIVVGGQKLGRELGFPTLNLARGFRQVTPADGIYAGECETDLGRFKAAISVGVRPSIDFEKTIEAFLLDYPGDDLYGSSVRLFVVSRLRDQLRFDNLSELKTQIARDVEQVSRVVTL